MDVGELRLLHNAKAIHEIKKGFSVDRKYQVDKKYLVRVFPKELLLERKKEFELLQALHSIVPYVPQAFEFGYFNGEGYMIIAFLNGGDGEFGMDDLSDLEQFEAGFLAGEVLRKMHALPLEVPKMNWFDFQTAKHKQKSVELEELNLRLPFLMEADRFINDNIARLKDRPICMQHGDFHPANIILNHKKFAGIIDFNRLEFGDPLVDLAKIGFFTTEVSVPFAQGNMLGYIKEQEIAGFWELYALYTAMHIVAAVSWAARDTSRNLEKIISYAAKTAVSHANFQQVIPNWMHEEELKWLIKK
ncbi:phosphotransferase [Listeria welshimeri]|nr:phosphotransferase [Listeria welshimeri]